MIYALTFHTDRLPDNVGGAANAFVVRIRPKYKDDKGIHRHEYEHVKQWYVVSTFAIAAIAIGSYLVGYSIGLATLGLAVHSMAYLFIDKYRLLSEAMAFAKQVKPDYSDIDTMSARLAGEHYNLGITQGQAEAAIAKYF